MLKNTNGKTDKQNDYRIWQWKICNLLWLPLFQKYTQIQILKHSNRHSYVESLSYVNMCMRFECVERNGTMRYIYFACTIVGFENPEKICFKEIAKNEIYLYLEWQNTRSMMCECDVLIEITFRNGNEL